MSTAYAGVPWVRLHPHVRQSLINRRAVPPSRWLEKILRELDEIDTYICEDWDSLDPQDRQFFHALVLGMVPRASMRERLDRAVWEVTTFYNMVAHRDEAIRYLTAVQEIYEKIKERVGAEVWREALSDEEQVARAKKGHEQISAGRFKTAYKP
ncbi:MAG TPA: hypothetical protein VMF11_08065 [Candidatus Baltobacteraceae bacterium]|nr:hypothetical protein [Candidatus Baltobacteraceae bacterium]